MQPDHSVLHVDANLVERALQLKLLGAELELIHGYLYANQWQTNYILKIDTSSGKVVGRLDLESIAAEARNKYSGSEVLNGIAYNPASGLLYVTGKLWPNIYEISVRL